MNRMTDAELKKFYGEDYVREFINVPTHWRLERLLPYMELNRQQHVADLACGSGVMMELAAPRVATYTGVDFSEAFIDAANENRKRLGITNASFELSAIGDFCHRNRERFDVCFAMDFSEHVYDDSWVEILTSIREAMKHGGHLYLHTPNARFLVEILKAHNFILRQFPEHIAVRDMEHNIALLEQAGFAARKKLFIPHYNILKWLHPLSFLPLAGRYLKARIFIDAVKE